MASMNAQFRVMIVDDEEEIQKSLQRNLRFMPEFQSVEVLCVSSFGEAMTRIEEQTPQIVLQDINLPDGNGLQLIRQFKKVHPAIQFIVITGASDLDRAMLALSYGAADYLRKPLDMDEMRTILTEAMRRCERWGELLWDEYDASQHI